MDLIMEMYKCNCCGEVFDEPVVTHWKEHVIEDIWMPGSEATCPWCGTDDFEEATECGCCGEYFLSDELYSGYCEACVREALEADLFFRFAVDGAGETQYSTFEDFMFSKVFRLDPSTAPKASSFELRDCLKAYYDIIAENDDFTDKAWEYLKDTANIECFVEWVIEERKEGC